MALTDKQERFCQEYLVDLNATQAAIRAKYPEKSAGSVGFENLQKPEIQDRIAELRKELQKKTEIDQEYVVRKLKNWSDAKITDVFDFDDKGNVKIKKLQDLPENVVDAIQEIQQTKDGIRIKLVDKKGSLVDIGRHLGLFVDKIEKRDMTFEDFLAKVKERKDEQPE